MDEQALQALKNTAALDQLNAGAGAAKAEIEVTRWTNRTLQRIQSLIEIQVQFTEWVSQFADRAVGEAPPAPEAEHATDVSSGGALGDIEDALLQLESRTRLLDTQVRRLADIL